MNLDDFAMIGLRCEHAVEVVLVRRDASRILATIQPDVRIKTVVTCQYHGRIQANAGTEVTVDYVWEQIG